MRLSTTFSTALVGLGLTAAATAQTVTVNNDITTSTTWTANNTYNLQEQIYVQPGASLTIEAGTVIASTTNLGGSLAVARGAQIFVQGTEANPVIFTSLADVATWSSDPSHPTGKNPKTGTWREAANEWGNLTIMGSGYISENATPGNVATANANNVAAMEGLTANPSFPGRTEYGGGNDDDDSGSIEFLSLRYGGKVISLNNELNGLSLGGIGRATDINHVEIMNNVDDGIEIWGGTVNLKHFAIWNIGDDSFDVDQGWRGKAQFGLIVQGYSLDASQGSGVGDNGFETDGAEDSDWEPKTTTTIYNCTFIGQPTDGDGATAWRDNARVQYRNCIFMDCGEKVVRFDNIDGDGANGYGHNGTLSWANTWTTAASTNPPLYQTQTNGNLAEIKDSVFYNNLHIDAYTEATARGVFNPSCNNVLEPFVSPIQAITRGPAVVRGGKVMEPVTFLDPRPANDAVSSVDFASNDNFFEAAKYRGAFAPGNNWLCSWTASAAFGFTPTDAHCDLGNSLGGTPGAPVLTGTGTMASGAPVNFAISNGQPASLAILVIGFDDIYLPFFGGTVVPNFNVGGTVVLFTDGGGNSNLGFNIPAGTASGFTLWTQAGVFDAGAPQGVSFSNALRSTTP